MQERIAILHLEGDLLETELIRQTLADDGLVADIERVDTEAAYLAALDRSQFDLILADYPSPSFDGLSALRIARAKSFDVPIILVSSAPGEELAIESLKSGATDYVLKERLQRLPLTVRRALREAAGRTEHRQAIEELRESEARYRRLFESAKDGILILDERSRRIVDVNPYLIQMLGYSKEEFVDKQLWEIGIFKDAVASGSAFAELKQQGYIHYENLPLETRDGAIRQVEFVSNNYLTGRRSVIQCNIRDITERKQDEETLRETNARLEQALEELQAKTQEMTSLTQQLWQASKLATMGELAASVAHELNNPLATVALRAESAMEGLLSGDAKRHALEIILQQVERMADLVSHLLQFSRRSYKQISSIDLREELRKALEFIEYYLRSHQIDVIQDFAGQLPTVQADRQQLIQVFLNLITNASDAMPAGGTLTVKIYASSLAEDHQAVTIEFSDTGNGVASADLPRLWEPFFTTKPEGKGTGLGLAICRRTVEEHRGTIEIETGPGKGTTVRIILPATDRGVAIAA
jgi:PAS domain S-box-containing protein